MKNSDSGLKFLCFICLLLIGYLSIGCTKNDDTSSQESIVANEINRGRILELINKERTKGCRCGTTLMPPVSPLTWNEKLEIAAFKHSQDMYNNGYFDHINQQGLDVGDRISNEGFKWFICGENIAKGANSAEYVITMWILSEGHCKNIMNESFKEVGVGRMGDTWTQVFGTER